MKEYKSLIVLSLLIILSACGNKSVKSVANSKWVNPLVTLSFKDSTCVILVKSPMTANYDTIISKYIEVGDTIRFLPNAQDINIQDLFRKGDSLVTLNNGVVKDYFLKE